MFSKLKKEEKYNYEKDQYKKGYSEKRSPWPKVILVILFLSFSWFMGKAQLERMRNDNSQTVTAPNITYLERIDANPIAITTPEVSDWVLGQDERVATEADLEALEVELKQIEIQQEEVRTKQLNLGIHSEYLDENSVRIQTEMYASLQNDIAQLVLRKGETQRKIAEAKGFAEAEAIEVKAITEANGIAEKARIENIELEASAELEASLMQAEADKALAEAKRDLAWANMYQSIAPLFSMFALTLTCLLVSIGFAPFIATQFRKTVSNATTPAPVVTTRPVPDAVDEVLGEAVKRATTPPVKRSAPLRNRPKQFRRGQNSAETPQKHLETPRNAQNSSENSKTPENSSNSVEYVTTNYPWVKKVFNQSDLEVIAGGLGDARPAGIVWKIAKMEIDQKGKKGKKISRREIQAALGVNGNAYNKFFKVDVEECRRKIILSRGGSVTTTATER